MKKLSSLGLFLISILLCVSFSAYYPSLVHGQTAILDQAHVEGLESAFAPLGTGRDWAQTVMPAISGNLSRIDLLLLSGNAGLELIIEIRSASGGLPTDTILSSTMLTILPGDFSWYSVSLPSQPYFAAGTPFAIVVRHSKGGGSIAISTKNEYANGSVSSRLVGETEFNLSIGTRYDFGFRSYVIPEVPTGTPSRTPSNTATFTLTPSNTATNTVTTEPSLTPTNTPTNTATTEPSSTPSNTATFTLTPSNTVTFTLTPSNTATTEPSLTPTNTATAEPSSTPSNTATFTPTPSNTSTNTATTEPSLTQTNTPTNTATTKPSHTPSNTATNTPTKTATTEPSLTPSNTATNTATSTVTTEPSPTPSNTSSNTATNTSTTEPSLTPTSTLESRPTTQASPTSLPPTQTNQPVPSSTPSPTATIAPSQPPKNTLYQVLLPRIGQEGHRPDLVSQLQIHDQSALRAGNPIIFTLTISNQGTAASGGFWVDLYINPSQPPSQANQTWDKLCEQQQTCYGLAWYVEGLAVGEQITLSTTQSQKGYLNWPGYLPAGQHALYAYVDTWKPKQTFGGVEETNEHNNRSELQLIVE